MQDHIKYIKSLFIKAEMIETIATSWNEKHEAFCLRLQAEEMLGDLCLMPEKENEIRGVK